MACEAQTGAIQREEELSRSRGGKGYGIQDPGGAVQRGLARSALQRGVEHLHSRHSPLIPLTPLSGVEALRAV